MEIDSIAFYLFFSPSPTSAGGSKATTTNRLVNKLNTLPNKNATSEHVKMITLYGMLKSGVARSTSRLDVYILLGFSESSRVEYDTIAGGRSQPLCASGGCSVY